MPTSRQRKQRKKLDPQGVKTTPLPPRGPKDKPGHLVTKREAVVMVMNVINQFVLSPAFVQAVQNINEFGTVIPPVQPPHPDKVRAMQTADQEDRRTPEDFDRAAKVLDMLQPEKPALVVVP